MALFLSVGDPKVIACVSVRFLSSLRCEWETLCSGGGIYQALFLWRIIPGQKSSQEIDG